MHENCFVARKGRKRGRKKNPRTGPMSYRVCTSESSFGYRRILVCFIDAGLAGHKGGNCRMSHKGLATSLLRRFVITKQLRLLQAACPASASVGGIIDRRRGLCALLRGENKSGPKDIQWQRQCVGRTIGKKKGKTPSFIAADLAVARPAQRSTLNDGGRRRLQLNHEKSGQGEEEEECEAKSPNRYANS